MRIGAIFTLLFAASYTMFAQGTGGGSLVTKVSPGRAGVFVDGKYVGPASSFRIARKYPVAAGEHEIKLVDPRYEEVVTKVTIQPGKKTKLAQTLKPLPKAEPPFGALRVQHADKFAPVYVNGKYCGHADEFSNVSQRLLLKPGEYEVKVEPASGAPIVQKVNIEAGKTVTVK
ncbi:MAG TPA: PEGA domain-containing protein [Bryobacteraceae bacterium]|nr:PEGA domain-containing protein [Bryobacteraceae bacterium]